MIDFHSHILPSVDDGSKSMEESSEMISMLLSQGVDTIVATPHFYADDESLDDFLSRRDAAYESLISSLTFSHPRILRGAEVSYYSGLSRLDELSRLCIEGTDLLLIEMPVCKWTEYSVREIESIALSGAVRVVLAHIERYYHLQKAQTWDRLMQCGVLMQVNASFFIRRSSRGKAVSLLRRNRIHLLGSDCHNLSHRPPRMGEAYEIIAKKTGESFTKDFIRRQRALLGDD